MKKSSDDLCGVGVLVTKPIRSTAETIAEKVQAYIRENDLAVGDLLPSIDKMAKLFSVSNSTMREAMQYLAAAGVVSIEQGRGTYIKDPEVGGLFSTPAWRMLCNSMTPEELRETLTAIDTQIMRLATKRVSLAQIRDMGDLLHQMEHALGRADYDAYMLLERQLRRLLSRASGNRLLAELTLGLRALPTFAIDKKNLVGSATESLSYYQEIHQALINGDAERASQLAIDHIRALDSLEPQQGLVIYYDILGTGSLGGSFYTLGQGIAKLIGDSTQIKLDISVTGGGIENVRLAQDRKIAIGITQADVAHDAFHGVGGFDFPHENIRLIGCLPGLELQISTLASSGIHSLEQLRNRPIAVGAHGGASVEVARRVLEHAGLEWEVDYDPKIVSFATSVDMLRNKAVDAVFYLSIGQSPALLELALESPIRFIELDEDLVVSLEARHPYWYKGIIETNTYPNQNRPVHTIGIPTILVTHKDLPEADAHGMTASVFMHTDEIQSLVWPPRVFKLQDAAREVGIPYHSGAERFFARHKITIS